MCPTDPIEQDPIAERKRVRALPDPTVRWSGRAMARAGRRMMPTFPSPSLRCRKTGFPCYGSKAGLSETGGLRSAGTISPVRGYRHLPRTDGRLVCRDQRGRRRAPVLATMQTNRCVGAAVGS